MLHTDQDLIADAKSTYDRACGAVSGSDYTGFLLALSVGFLTGDQFGSGTISTAVIQFGSGLLVLAAVRTYFRHHQRIAEDAYHRVAGLGKYATTTPSVGKY